MLNTARKYALDTNVFIRSFRDDARFDELERFRTAYAPFEYLSAVVVAELRSGARATQDARLLERRVLAPFERRKRVFAPTYASWKRAGETLARLATLDGTSIRTFGRTFFNDALLAVSCQQAGIVLVTENVSDFARIRRALAFEFVEAWT